MRIVLEHIFKKHWYVIAIAFLALILGKYFTVLRTFEQQPDTTYTKQWISQMYGMNPEEREHYFSQLLEKLYASSNADSSPSDDASVNPTEIELALFKYWQLYADHQNQREFYNLIQFAQKGEGIIPIGLPTNYLDLLEFYANLSAPSLINEAPLDIYFDLQEASLLPLLAFFVLAVYFALHYETQVYQYAKTTPKGNQYNQNLKATLIALILLLLISNEVFDLLISGVIFDKQLLQASIQSYSEFQNVQVYTTIETCIFYLFLAKLLGILLICQFTDLIARFTKNTKDTMIAGAFFFLFSYLLTQTLSSTQWLPCVQIGMIDWNMLVKMTRIHLELGISYATLGILISAFMTIGSIIVLKKCHGSY